MAAQAYRPSKDVASKSVVEKHGSRSASSRNKLPLQSSSSHPSMKPIPKAVSSKGNLKNKTSQMSKTYKVSQQQKPFKIEPKKESSLKVDEANSTVQVAAGFKHEGDTSRLSTRMRDLSMTQVKDGQERALTDSDSENDAECFRIQQNGYGLFSTIIL